MRGSFFELVTRYSERPRRDPGENRLTAVLAAVLQERPSLARRLVTSLLPQLALDENPAVNTQTTIRLADGRHAFLDMEITAQGPPPTTVWIEVKRTSGESGIGQFEKYRRALALKGGRRALLILSPVNMRAHLGALPPAREWCADAPVVARWVSWEEAYSALAELRAELIDPWEEWAVDELLLYLDMEGLQPMPVKHAHVAALATIDDAAKAVTTLVANVEHSLAIQLGEPAERSEAPRTYYYELRYRPARVDPGGNWAAGVRIAWGVDRTEFFAGICTPDESAPTDGMDVARTEDWRASFDDAEWRRIPGLEYWIWKVLPLEVLADAGGMAEQAEHAATFARETIGEIVASLAAY